jgi:polyvinyl alcohol dehydrogenase (cytochrome)
MRCMLTFWGLAVGCMGFSCSEAGPADEPSASQDVAVGAPQATEARVQKPPAVTPQVEQATPSTQPAAGAVAAAKPADDGQARDEASSDQPAPDQTHQMSADWRSYGHDLSNTRHNPSEQHISAANVAQLEPKWAWSTSAVTSTPVYYDGTLYFGDWQNYIVALDATSGMELWRVLGPELVPAQVTASVLVEQASVYIGVVDAVWYKLDRKTGAVQWQHKVHDGGSPNMLSSLARVGDHLIAGVASFQNVNPLDSVLMAKPFHGSVVARNALTGEPAWEFVLTTGTGVGVCSSAAFDLQRKRLFVGTGQNYDTTDSPYADSLVALSYETGEYVWHAQFTAGDTWNLTDMDDGDLDILSSPVLFSAGGVDMVAAGDKGGSFRAFARDDGQMQWQRQLAPGGHHGGVMGSPAYHDGVIYVCSGDYSTDSGAQNEQSGPDESVLFALAAASGEPKWQVKLQGSCYGSITHANGIVYLATGDGHLRAFRDVDGSELTAIALGNSSAGGVTIASATAGTGCSRASPVESKHTACPLGSCPSDTLQLWLS